MLSDLLRQLTISAPVFNFAIYVHDSDGGEWRVRLNRGRPTHSVMFLTGGYTEVVGFLSFVAGIAQP